MQNIFEIYLVPIGIGLVVRDHMRKQYHSVRRTYLLTLCTLPCKPVSNQPLPHPPVRTCALMMDLLVAKGVGCMVRKYFGTRRNVTDQNVLWPQKPPLVTLWWCSSALECHTMQNQRMVSHGRSFQRLCQQHTKLRRFIDWYSCY